MGLLGSRDRFAAGAVPAVVMRDGHLAHQSPTVLGNQNRGQKTD